jgi:putative phosphoesterase
MQAYKKVIKIKVAVISDVHGNSVALKEVLQDAKKNGVNKFIFPGDLINDLPFGNETLELMRNVSEYFVYGNKEEYLKEYNRCKYTWENIQFKPIVFMNNELTKENLEFISNIPMLLSLEFDGVKVKVVHGSPNSIEEQIHESSTDLIDKYTKNLEEDILIFGHTHEPVWSKIANGKLVVNAGCTGVTPYYLRTAEYIILHINNKDVKVEKRLVEYDTNLLKLKIKKSGILDVDKVLMGLTYNAVTGNGNFRRQFFTEAKQMMKDRNHNLYKDDAKGIYKYFKLYDDDIWVGLYEKYIEQFEF